MFCRGLYEIETKESIGLSKRKREASLLCISTISKQKIGVTEALPAASPQYLIKFTLWLNEAQGSRAARDVGGEKLGSFCRLNFCRQNESARV